MDILYGVPVRQRSKLLRDVFDSVHEQMSPADRANIERARQHATTALTKFGDIAFKELYVTVAVFMAERSEGSDEDATTTS